ncbi:MAG: hypothetical protein RIC55_22880 [Pirellulaceae bacterium]
MGEELLVSGQIDAGADFIRDFDDYVSVSVAFWVAPSESEQRYLYIASDEIDDTNTHAAYGEVLRRLQVKQGPWLDPFQVKLINTSDRIARAAIEIRDRYSTPLPTRYGGSSLGGLSIDGAYIYPPVSALNTAT